MGCLMISVVVVIFCFSLVGSGWAGFLMSRVKFPMMSLGCFTLIMRNIPVPCHYDLPQEKPVSISKILK